ncbi:DUF2953 domain-containing protein [Clostridium sp. Marseille-P2415]|uniref:DUF2953 domain-containing protein n=1 Tax=Clostridium sp. Marseille-P2415 TaxID=1805471 RepID=UPI0009884456|nr:DUF2953 domain-containing protein [Clostridium sp. Marseille-P2415]
MLHIILLLLKILGLFVLIVLGLILSVFLLVLLVPVRYRAEGSYYGKVKGHARFSWLLHILTVTVSYEKDLTMAVRLFGFRILKPKKLEAELEEAKDIMVQTMEIREPEALREVKEEIREKPKGQLPPPKEETKHGKKPGLCLWLSRLKRKVLRVLSKLKFFFHRIYDTLKAVKEKKTELCAWVSDKDNQKTVKLFFKQAKKLIRHILPRRGKGNITFGFDDPYLTGQVLTYASVIYPLCHKHLNLYPVFDRNVFTAEGTFRGRVRLGTVLLIGIRMLLDKNFRLLLKRWLR